MFDKDGKLDERSQRILSEQTIPPRYGRSPAMAALDELRNDNKTKSAELAANERVRRDGARVMYTLKPGETAKMVTYGVLVCHPDRPPKLINWDGSEEPITIDADHTRGPRPA